MLSCIYDFFLYNGCEFITVSETCILDCESLWQPFGWWCFLLSMEGYLYCLPYMVMVFSQCAWRLMIIFLIQKQFIKHCLPTTLWTALWNGISKWQWKNHNRDTIFYHSVHQSMLQCHLNDINATGFSSHKNFTNLLHFKNRQILWPTKYKFISKLCGHF